MKEKFTVTAALPYANGPIHLGHIAGVYLPANIFVRFLRMNDADVLFVCGSDEHGAAITLRAKKEGVTPKDIVDKYHSLIGDSFEKFGIEFDVYDRTSSELHHQTSSAFFKELNNSQTICPVLTVLPFMTVWYVMDTDTVSMERMNNNASMSAVIRHSIVINNVTLNICANAQSDISSVCRVDAFLCIRYVMR